MCQIPRWIVTALIACALLLAFRNIAATQDRDARLAEAKRLDEQIATLYTAGHYDEAISLAKMSVAIRKEVLGAEHPDVGTAINNLAALYYLIGNYEQAEQLFKQCLAIAKQAFGPKHVDVADALHNLGALYYETGDYQQAKSSYEEALALRKELLGLKHPSVASSFNGLAQVYADEGDYVQAEQLFRQSLEIQETTATLNNLALLYKTEGDYARAEKLLQRSLKIRREALGAQHPDVATSLNNLAGLYEDKGDYTQAESLYRQAMDILVAVFGPKHLRVSTPLTGIAAVYNAKGDYAQAESLYEQALEIREKALGSKHPDIAILLNNIAQIRRNRGDYERAEALYKRVLEIREAALPAQHPLIASTLTGFALLYGSKGDYAKATQFLARANQIQEDNLSLILTTGSENQKRLYLDTLTADTYVTLSLHAHYAPQSGAAAQLALTTILQRKGRALDAMADQLGVLERRATPEVRGLLDELIAARSHLANLQISGGGRLSLEARREKVVILAAEVERLEGEVSRRSVELRAQTAPITLEAVRRVIPGGAALVEIIWYLPYNIKAKSGAEKWGAPRYLAYVERGDMAVPQYVDLGEATLIDAGIQRLRAALRNSGRDVRAVSRDLDERIMRPIRNLLGPLRRLFLSPDGALNLIPFAALVDEHGKYLVENYSLTYLTSGRDLLRLQSKAVSRQAPLIMADPLYDMAAGSSTSISQDGQNRRSLDFTLPKYERLNATAEEAAVLGKLWPHARVLTKDDAAESALKQVRGPSILHIATHGFFLADQRRGNAANRFGANAQVGESASPSPARRSENPLLRSGLALAGANQLQDGKGDDGILTALEASGLDLRGTKLVVLSACESGLGDVRRGEGVYGLRRALVLAGSESQVISLWRVNDKATRDFMVSYYRLLLAGRGRSDALRQVQLRMIAAKSKGWSHPYFWAGFIGSGDWRSLKDQ
jgi:CHAT domain-containing protein/tetratricopeptide (TPR) repeat protein